VQGYEFEGPELGDSSIEGVFSDRDNCGPDL
jgi:hypothetical protein